MKKIFILTAIFLISFCFSQTHRFIYEQTFKKDSTENKMTTEIFHLDINSDEIYFYARDYFVLDSIMKNKLQSNFVNAPNLSNIYIHKKNTNFYNTYEITEYNTYKFESTDKQEWKLTNEQKKIGQFTVQKAFTRWAGRSWTAWFSPDIPFTEGPYKFHGLPGIIMELSDDKGNYTFKLVKSENFKNSLNPKDYFAFFLTDAIPISEEKYLKLKLSFYQDPLSFLKMQDETFQFTDDNWVMLKDGTKVTKDNQKEVRFQQQNSIKKYNNPIEINKVIKYPDRYLK